MNMKRTKKCTVDGCPRPFESKGYCRYHSWFIRYTGQTTNLPPAPPMKEKKCLIEGCEETNLTTNFKKGYCYKHYRRIQLYGDPHYMSRAQERELLIQTDINLSTLTEKNIKNIE